MNKPAERSENHIIEPARPRPRVLLRWMMGLVVASSAAAALVFAYRAGPKPPELFRWVPRNVQLAALLDWPSLVATPGFSALEHSIATRLLGEHETPALYRRVGIESKSIKSALVALRSRPVGREVMVLLRLHDDFDAHGWFSYLRDRGFLPIRMGSRELLRSPGKRSWLGGMLEGRILVFGDETMVRAAASTAGKASGSLAGVAEVPALLGRVDNRAILFSVGTLSDPWRSRLRRVAPAAGSPTMFAASLDDRARKVSLRVSLHYPNRSAASDARRALESWLKLKAEALDRNGAVLRGLGPIAAGFAHEARVDSAGVVVFGRATVEIERQGLLGVVRETLVPALYRRRRLDQVRREVSNLDRIAQAAVAYLKRPRKTRRRGSRSTAVVLASVGKTPAGDPCKMPAQRFVGRPDDWNHPTWKALGFALRKPHLLQYEVLSEGTGPRARVTVRATADLDCRGDVVTMERSAWVTPDGSIHLSSPTSRDRQLRPGRPAPTPDPPGT